MFHLLFTKLRMVTSLMAKDFTVTGMRTSDLTDGIMSQKALIVLKTSNFSHTHYYLFILLQHTVYSRI